MASAVVVSSAAAHARKETLRARAPWSAATGRSNGQSRTRRSGVVRPVRWSSRQSARAMLASTRHRAPRTMTSAPETTPRGSGCTASGGAMSQVSRSSIEFVGISSVRAERRSTRGKGRADRRRGIGDGGSETEDQRRRKRRFRRERNTTTTEERSNGARTEKRGAPTLTALVVGRRPTGSGPLELARSVVHPLRPARTA
jgi:hypothetical protein